MNGSCNHTCGGLLRILKCQIPTATSPRKTKKPILPQNTIILSAILCLSFVRGAKIGLPPFLASGQFVSGHHLKGFRCSKLKKKIQKAASNSSSGIQFCACSPNIGRSATSQFKVAVIMMPYCLSSTSISHEAARSTSIGCVRGALRNV